MTLVSAVVELLERNQTSCCLIGAAAMAAYGVPRSTLDVDLLTTDARVLEEPFWTSLEETGSAVDIRRGDLEDPLAGVIRISKSEERPVDLIVGKLGWQQEIVDRAIPLSLLDLRLLVAEPADLVLLKLYAGGPQDRWDIQQLLVVDASEGLSARVEERLGSLPRSSVELWRELSSSET